jgi:ribonuclease T2
MISRAIVRACLLPALLILLASGPVAAQGRHPGLPGVFDFYVLSLSWSPSFCEAAGDRSGSPQCGERPYSFVVHGLWPQFERGFPKSCQVPAPRLARQIVDSMLDLMPAPRLIYHEWDEHGTCSGLSPDAYFATVRKARAKVKIPPEFADVKSILKVSPAEVKQNFIKANPGLAEASMAVECDNRLKEVRICLDKELVFRDCPDVVRRSCRRDEIVMPPVRGP